MSSFLWWWKILTYLLLAIFLPNFVLPSNISGQFFRPSAFPIFILNRRVQSKTGCLTWCFLQYNHLHTLYCILRSVVLILHKAHCNATHDHVNRAPFCDIFGYPYISWDNFWSVSSTGKFRILWKSQEKLLSTDKSYIWRLYGNRKKKTSASVRQFEGCFMETNG